MDENEANKANYTEVANHISKALDVIQSASAPSKAEIDNLCDYYERAVQLRQMHAETLAVRLTECDTGRRKYRFATIMLALVFALVGVVLAVDTAEKIYPGALGRTFTYSIGDLKTWHLSAVVFLFFAAPYLSLLKA